MFIEYTSHNCVYLVRILIIKYKYLNIKYICYLYMDKIKCTCCENKFTSDANLKRHRIMKLQHSLHKYRQYLEDMNSKNNICNCICCKCNFPPMNMNNQQEIDWRNCQLRIIMSAELNPLWGNVTRSEGNDIHTDLMDMICDFKTNPNILDKFINYVNDINFCYSGFTDDYCYMFDL